MFLVARRNGGSSEWRTGISRTPPSSRLSASTFGPSSLSPYRLSGMCTRPSEPRPKRERRPMSPRPSRDRDVSTETTSLPPIFPFLATDTRTVMVAAIGSTLYSKRQCWHLPVHWVAWPTSAGSSACPCSCPRARSRTPWQSRCSCYAPAAVARTLRPGTDIAGRTSEPSVCDRRRS